MILTYKYKHKQNFERELSLAKKIAEIGLETKTRSSADVKHVGLKSMIANQILKKYSSNKKIKNVHKVNLTIPNQGIRIIDGIIYIPSLKLTIPVWFNVNFEKINQIEINKNYAFISVTYKDSQELTPTSFYGMDLNTTGHCAVDSNSTTEKVLKLGKQAHHIHNKYKNIRKKLQKKGKYKLVKKIKHRESNVIKNINHHISKKINVECKNSNSGIVLEDLKGIRKTSKSRKKQRYSLNSWSFYQLKQMIEYKSKKYGIPVFYIEPQYTSQRCSVCGHIESSNRKGKLFQCKKCGKVENADVNAGFNIALCHQSGISRFIKDRDLIKGSTDTPREVTI